jgi:hypothetical protein
MRSKRNKLGKLATIGLVTLVAAFVAGASCGGTKGSGFGDTPGGSSGSSGGGDGGGFGDDSSICFGQSSCGGGGSFDGSFPGPAADGGQMKVMTGVLLDECTGIKAVPSGTVTSLLAGGAVDSAMKWLYPYDQTVFPGGIMGPVLQWAPQSGGADAVYLHMKSQIFEYKGCFGKTSPMQLTIPATAWAGAWNQSNGSADPLSVEVTTIAGGKVSGPITEHWTFALGSLKGLIYYNTYTSPQVGNNGAVMVVKPGTSMPTPLLAITGTSPVGPCISCHSLSANGSMIVAQKHFYPGGLTSPGSMSFSLGNGATINATNPVALASTMNDDWGLSAVYIDGTRLLTAGEPTDSTAQTGLFPCGAGDNPGMIGPKVNLMYDTKTGMTIPFSGLAVSGPNGPDAGVGPHAMMPMFSPDGTKIVFNDTDNHQGHSLMVQDFDAATNTFSNPVTIYNDTKGLYPGWPFFTPDSSRVIFVLGAAANFSSIPPASFSDVGPVQAAASDVSTGDLYVVDLASPGTAHSMDLANGVRNGASYLPYPGRDEHLNFYPTGSPVAAGGYFWAFFTSRRQYGNVMTDSTVMPPAVPDPVFHAETKKIWVTAISIDAVGDPSHPAFYLPGQEAPSGNIRAFAALAPCAASGASCMSGIDCCGGYCTNGSCGKPTTCSMVDNKCTTTADCCMGSGLKCIGGFCSTVVQ